MRRGKSNTKKTRLRLLQPSSAARDRAMHVLAAMRRDRRLSLTRAAKLEGVKPETVKKYFSSALRKSGGKFKATKSDRFAETLYLPDKRGNAVLVPTRSSKERTQASAYLRDLGRHLRGKKNVLAKWHDKQIAGVELITDPRTIVAIEPALSDFSLYKSFSGGAM
jgi:hypothetical protein